MLAEPPAAAERALEFSLVVPIKPKGQGRPRFDPRSKRAYTPQNTRAYVDTLRCAAFDLWEGRDPLSGPVSVFVRAVFKLPQRGGLRRFHTQRPDGSNILKAAEDALNGIVFGDDAQIVEARVRKEWSVEADAISIQVWSLQ